MHLLDSVETQALEIYREYFNSTNDTDINLITLIAEFQPQVENNQITLTDDGYPITITYTLDPTGRIRDVAVITDGEDQYYIYIQDDQDPAAGFDPEIYDIPY